MFTGIVQSIGVISDFEHQGKAALVGIKTSLDLKEIENGESVAINGVCLTLVRKQAKKFWADLSDETLQVTAFATARVGDKVNLERALRFSDRLGGHWVTGHVDSVGEIQSIEKTPGSIKMRVGYDARAFSKYLVHKGSVAVDGVSLTLSLEEGLRRKQRPAFAVCLIPYTCEKTTLLYKRVGDPVNLEWDYLAKIVEKLLSKKR